MPPKSKPKAETVYPDSTDMHLRSITDLATGAALPTLNDLAKPETVQLLLSQHAISLTELKTQKGDNGRLQDDIRQLIAEREQLRIDLAKAKERRSVLLLEVPMSILVGFATEILQTNPTDGTGWILLVVSLVMLVMVRKPFQTDRTERTKEHDSSPQN